MIIVELVCMDLPGSRLKEGDPLENPWCPWKIQSRSHDVAGSGDRTSSQSLLRSSASKWPGTTRNRRSSSVGQVWPPTHHTRRCDLARLSARASASDPVVFCVLSSKRSVQESWGRFGRTTDMRRAGAGVATGVGGFFGQAKVRNLDIV